MENSKTITLSVNLRGENYLLWSRTTKIALSARGLWEHVTESEVPKITRRESDKEGGKEITVIEEDKKWYQEDQTVLFIIQNSLEPSILEAYSHCETAKELWETLKNVFGNVSNLSRVFEVKRSLNNLSQETETFTKHFGKFSSLWAELDMLRPTTTDLAIINERREQDKVFSLLQTLNSSSNGLIRHLLRADKLPRLDEVCMQVQKEEGSLSLFNTKSELLTAHKGTLKQESFTANKGTYPKKYICDHCNKRGHTKDKCWILHPHLKPNRWDKTKANFANDGGEMQLREGSSARQPEEGKHASSTYSEFVRKSDLEELIKSINALKENGKSLYASKSSKTLIVDSGASHHMISNPKLIHNIKPALGSVEIANGDKIPIKGIGDLKLFDKNTKAFYIPTFQSNLLSVNKTTSDLNCYAIFGPNNVCFQDIKTGQVLGEGVTKDGLYHLEDTKLTSHLSCAFNSSNLNDSVWHARMGHPHSRALSLLFPSIVFKNDDCEACILGKHCKSVFPKSLTIYENCFDLVHSDVWSSPCESREQQKYFVTFIDEKSKYTWLTLLPSKDRVLDAFSSFHKYVTNQYNAKIKILRTDNGGEYMSNAFKQFIANQGIIHQTTCPYTPQQNGVAERKNRHLMEVARSMMFHTNVPKRFWGDAVITACYLINRTPTKVLNDMSPFEVLNKVKPSINHLRVFGCVCFVLIAGEQRNKLEAKSVKGIFIGYSTTQKGYKCYIPESRKVLVSRDVKFVENKGHYDEKNWEELQDLSKSLSDKANNLKIILEDPEIGIPRSDKDVVSESQNNNRELAENQTNHDLNTYTEHPQDEPSEELDQTEEIHNLEDDVNTDQGIDETPSLTPLRRSTRIRHKPVRFNNHAVAHPIQKVCSLDLLPTNHQAFLGKIDLEQIPQNYEEAKERKEWRDAVNDEVGAMVRNNTWYEANLPPEKKAVSSKWVFTIKYRSDGEIERYKARLVARGFTQIYGEDYMDTFAPVAKLHTVRVVLSLATNLSWELWQMDVKNAFLQGDLEEEVYMYPPPGLEDTIQSGKVLRLRKAIYGLKQSPRAWYHKLSSTLKTRGFKKSEADHTLFTIHSAQGIIVVLIYVDDLIISGDDKNGIASTKSFLKSVFDIKDLGELKYFLGIEVCRSTEGLFISQRKYTLDLLNETGKIGSKPVKSPLEDGYKVNRKGEKNDEPFKDALQYRRLVGKLIYLTITRPDICFAVNQVSQHMQNPTVYHWSMAERILRYLKNSPGQGVWMGRNDNTEITGYCDADWAGDRMDRKSTTGYCTFIGGNLVTWKSKKQKVVSCSSAEAEYRAMRKLTDELIWLKALLKDLGIESQAPITMHCDNQAAIHIASNSVFHERTKHIEVDCHKVREKVEEGIILPCFTRSSDQLADIFTKAASSKVCEFINSKLGLIDLSRP